MTFLWLISVFFALGAGACAGMTSCRKEQGDQYEARRLSMLTMALVCFSIGTAGFAWSLQ